jgi:Rrf2 family protein
MLQFTKRTEYALIALVHLVDRRGEFVSARELADRYPVPPRLVAEVLKELQREGLVDSQRGAAGGYALARPAADITLAEIVTVLEGAPLLTSCDTGFAGTTGSCEVEPTCPIRSPIHRVRDRIRDVLSHVTLESLAHPNALPLLTPTDNR